MDLGAGGLLTLFVHLSNMTTLNNPPFLLSTFDLAFIIDLLKMAMGNPHEC